MNRPAGFSYALISYGMWGVFPIYFAALAPLSPMEIVAWRIILSLLFCALLLLILRGERAGLLALSRRTRLVLTLGMASVLMYFNWMLYIFATLGGNVLESSLGYFINPLVTILLAVVVLRERLRPAQWAAIGISAAAVMVLAVGYGKFPWIGLGLALTFGFYGLIKKYVGTQVSPLAGFTVETAWILPVAVVQLVLLDLNGALMIGSENPGHTALVLLVGVATAVPLLFFAAAARRLSLTSMGLIQYTAPSIQFIVGAFIFAEPMPAERWVGFVLVWIAIIVLIIDMLTHVRNNRQITLVEPT